MNYKFIDIGCSHLAVSSDLFGTDVKGIYVEPIKEYLDCLPEGKNIIKECCAITEEDGDAILNSVVVKDPVYFSASEMQKIIGDKLLTAKFLGKYSGSGQSTFANATRIRYLRGNAIEKIPVKTMSLRSFLNKHNVTSVDYLKIDVEGHEESILKQLLPIMQKGDLKINKELRFEYNQLSDKQALLKLAEEICAIGGFEKEYSYIGWDEDMVLIKI